MLKKWALVSVFYLCFSSYSLAYDPQYTIGSTGPSGGTVTSVEIISTLQGTEVIQNGDFEETTYTYKYTETVTEDVTSTQQITTTTIETIQKTTGDIITNNSLANGSVTCSESGDAYRDPNGCAYHTRIWDDGHIQKSGGYQFSTNLNNYLTQEEINYGFSVTASNNVYTTSPVSTWSITLKVVDPTTGNDYQKTQTWALNLGYNDALATSLQVPENQFGSDAILSSTFYGQDNSANAGWIFTPYDFKMSVDYFELTTVLTTIEQTIINSIQTSLNTLEDTLEKKYNPIVQPGTENIISPALEEPTKIEIKLQSPTGDGIRFDVKVETTPEGTVNVSMTDAKSGETQIAEIKPIQSMASAESKVEVKLETKSESSSNSSNKSNENKKSDNKKENESKGETKSVSVTEAKQKIADRILQQVLSETNNILINDTKIGLMIALADTENFAKYVAKQNADLAEWYNDKGIYNNQKDLPDPYAIVFSLAQDKKMNDMENEQYKKTFGKGFNLNE